MNRKTGRLCALIAVVTASALLASAPARAQENNVTKLDLPVGRSYPITTSVPITKVSIANPDVADVVLVGDREIVIEAKASGETDAIYWLQDGTRHHYRVSVHSPADRMQVELMVKFAEVRRDALRDITASGHYYASGVNGNVRGATGNFSTDKNFNGNGVFNPDTIFQTIGGRFLSILTDLDTKRLLVFLEAQEQNGTARLLAEPTIIAANKEDATFLAGGQLPIPVVQGAGGDVSNARVTIDYKDYGVKLNFNAEIISDSLIKLKVSPEVSSLDFGNALLISGFRIPALLTRSVTSTVDVRRDESLVLSGFFDTEEQRVKTGIPLLMSIPILGQLFSSTSFKRNESELIVVVTPVVIDPMHPRPANVLQFKPDSTIPAKDALKPRLPDAPDSTRQKP